MNKAQLNCDHNFDPLMRYCIKCGCSERRAATHLSKRVSARHHKINLDAMATDICNRATAFWILGGMVGPMPSWFDARKQVSQCRKQVSQ